MLVKSLVLPLSLLSLTRYAAGQEDSSSVSGSVSGSMSVLSSSGSMSGSGSASSLPSTPTASADFPSLTGYSACVSNCLNIAVAYADCVTVVDPNCYCPSDTFTDSYTDCIMEGCPNELVEAEDLAQQFCDPSTGLSSSESLSFSITSVPSSTPSSSSSSPTSAPPSSDATTTSPAPSGTDDPDNDTDSGAALQVGFTGAVASLGMFLAMLW